MPSFYFLPSPQIIKNSRQCKPDGKNITEKTYYFTILCSFLPYLLICTCVLILSCFPLSLYLSTLM